LGAKNRKGGHTGAGREMSRPGIVANERRRLVHQRKQLSDCVWSEHSRFSIAQPPIALVRVTHHLNLVLLLPKAGGEFLIIFQRPDPDWLGGSGVNQDWAVLIS